jgi:hypothetical protein
MSIYYTNEGAFELDGFTDHTVHALDTTLPDGKRLTFVASRNKIPVGKSLRDMVTDYIKQQATRLSGYAVIEQWDDEWAGAPAIEVRARWRHEGGVLYQRQTHFAVLDLCLFFGMTAPLDQQKTCDARMEQVRQTLRLRDQE